MNNIMTKRIFQFCLLSGILFLGFSLKKEKSISTITFGSCNRQDKEQPMWPFIVESKPDLWIWLGDNIYGDTDDMKVLEEKYNLQKRQPEYQKLIKNTPVIGIWDDHDFGKNDAGIEYPFKKESQQLMLDFLDEPKNSARRKQEGAYASYTYGSGQKQVKVILLDARYFRDSLQKQGKNYIPNLKGDILGEQQWKWLEEELKNSKASLNIIGSGIQFIPDEHPYEKWANFPKARKRLFDIIAGTKAKGVILLSGDRHIAEISKLEYPSISYPIYEVTASGLTHSSTNNTSEVNKHRVGKLVNVLNFGQIDVEWNKRPLEVKLLIKGLNNQVLEEQKVVY
jgi:alkaline phosphatase D